MPSSIAPTADRRHLSRLERVQPTMAKVDLNPIENRDFREQIGHAVQRAIALAGWSQKEAAAAIGKEPAQVARWIAGTERPQFDAMFAVEALRRPLVVALAEAAGAGVEVETTVRILSVGSREVGRR